MDERLRDMFAEPRTCVWAVFKRAAGDSGKTSPLSLGLTWIGTTYSGMKESEPRRRILDRLKEVKRLTVRTPLIGRPWMIRFMVATVGQHTRQLAGIWKPCTTVRLFI